MGVACTYEASAASVQQFRDELPSPVRQKLEDVLNNHREFAQAAAHEDPSDPKIAARRLIQGTNKLYDDLIKIRNSPEVSEEVEYALRIVSEKQRKPPLQRWPLFRRERIL